MNREIKVELKTILSSILFEMRNDIESDFSSTQSYSDILGLTKKEWYTYKHGYTPKYYNDHGGKIEPYVGRHGYGYIILTNDLERTTQYSKARYMILSESLRELMPVIFHYKMEHMYIYDEYLHDKLEKVFEIVKDNDWTVKW